MKHTLLRRHGWLTLASVLILSVMLLPVGIFAAVASPTVAADGGTMSLAALGMFGLPMMLRDEASDSGEGGGGIDTAAALAKVEDRTLTMSERLSIAAKALRGIDPTNQLATVNADLTQARADLAERDATISQLQNDLQTANARIASLEQDVKQADQARAAAETEATTLRAAEQDLDKRAKALAKEQLGALGIASNQLPKTDPKAGEIDDKKAAETAILELKGSRRIEAALHFKQHGKLPDWMNN